MANYLEFSKEKTVSIWIGGFSSRSEFDDYLTKNIDGDDNDDSPINKFARDIGIGFYDTDAQEAEFKDKGLPVKDLLARFWCADSYLASAVAAADLIGVEQANAAVLLFNFDYAQSLRANSASPLRFLGTFKCDPEFDGETKI